MPSTRDVELLSYGDCIIEGEYSLHARFRQAVNFVRNDNLISIVSPAVGAGPLNLVLSDVADVEADRVVVCSDSLQVGRATFALNAAGRYNSVIEIPANFSTPTFRQGLLLFKDTLRKHAPPDSLCFLLYEQDNQSPASGFEAALEKRFRNGCRLLKEGCWIDGVHLMKGLGRGLTPSGDDFISGFLIALNLRQSLFQENTSAIIKDIYRAAAGNNLFSMAFLRCAKDGRTFDRLKQVLFSVLSVNQDNMSTTVQRLVKVGGTTGADIAAGLVFGLELSLSIS